MTRDEMKEYIRKNVKRQGTMGALALAPLLSEIVDKLFAGGVQAGDGETRPGTSLFGGAEPFVVKIEGDGNKIGTKTTYEVVNNQEDIDEYIAKVADNKAQCNIIVQDGDVTICFTYIENSGDTITAVSSAPDGTYTLYLSEIEGASYFQHDDETKAIASVTESEIEAYNQLFGAQYDPVTNKFNVIVGTVHTSLSPGQMMITNEEYNKSSNDANYTVMWANSIAEYICCPKWFPGFTAFNLHSAFYQSKRTIFVDLNTVELPVANLTNTFSGCERLEQITGILKVTSATPLQGVFDGCSVLHSVKLAGLASSLNLSDCAQLSAESVEFIVSQSNQPTSGSFTITLNANVKYKLENDPTWESVRTEIAEKTYVNIQ